MALISKTWWLASAMALTGLLATGCDPIEPGASGEDDDPVVLTQDMGAGDQGMTSEDQGGGGEEDMASEPDMVAPRAPLEYYSDIKPIVYRTCEGCHISGGSGPYKLDTYESLKANIDIAMMAVHRGDMPPWSPDPECRNFKNERLIAEEEIAAIEQWMEDGMLEGDERDWEEPIGGMTLAPPDIVGKQNAAYTPSETRTDDYHCFLIDTIFEEDTYVTGTNVIPGNDELVHHANLFLINPTNGPTVERLQDRDEDAGYECFGDAGINQTSIIGAWVPGATPIFTPPDAAIVIPKGSRLVLQTHYNSLYTDPVPVSSEVHLYTTPEPPALRARALPLANLTFEVPPGEKESEHTFTVKNSSAEDWVVIGTAPHLHLLASEVKVEVIRKEGSEEEDACLIDIPDWDFNWQQEYRFLDEEWVRVHPGDLVRLTCVFDNSPENQPIVDGQPLPPETVTWGGKTNDEMCLNFLVLLQEYDPTLMQGPLCSPFKTCRAECDDPYSVGCIFNCATVEQDCGECLLFGAQDCANRYCRKELRPTIGCLLTCAQGAQAGGDIDACLREECPTEYEDLEVCIRPYIEQGLCNTYVEECNVEF